MQIRMRIIKFLSSIFNGYSTSNIIPANDHLQEQWWGKHRQRTPVPRFQAMSAYKARPTKNSKYIQDVQKEKIYKTSYFYLFLFIRSNFGLKPYSGKYHINSRQMKFQTWSTDMHSTKHTTAPLAHTRSRSIQHMQHNSHYSHHYSLDYHHIYTPTTSDDLKSHMSLVIQKKNPEIHTKQDDYREHR